MRMLTRLLLEPHPREQLERTLLGLGSRHPPDAADRDREVVAEALPQLLGPDERGVRWSALFGGGHSRGGYNETPRPKSRRPCPVRGSRSRWVRSRSRS